MSIREEPSHTNIRRPIKFRLQHLSHFILRYGDPEGLKVRAGIRHDSDPYDIYAPLFEPLFHAIPGRILCHMIHKKAAHFLATMEFLIQLCVCASYHFHSSFTSHFLPGFYPGSSLHRIVGDFLRLHRWLFLRCLRSCNFRVASTRLQSSRDLGPYFQKAAKASWLLNWLLSLAAC